MKVNIAGMKCEGSDAKLEKLKDKRTVSSEEIMDAIRNERQQRTGRFKSGLRKDVEEWKSRLIDKFDIDKDSEEYENWTKGWVFASGWEANLARIFLLKRENGLLKEVLYEPETFDFRPIKKWQEKAQKGMLSCTYKPDYRVKHCNERLEFTEVKGRFFPGGFKKLRNFNEFFPELFRGMSFVVMRDEKAHEQIRKLSYVRREQFTFYQDLKAEYQHIVRWE